MRRRIYISGPLTSSGDLKANVDRAIEAHRTLTRHGFAPLCPHLSWQIDPDNEMPHETWMELDVPWVNACEAVYRLQGESKGADIEVETAKAAGIPVFRSVDDLLWHFSPDRYAEDTPQTVKFASGAVRSADAEATRYDLVTPIGLRRVAEAYAEGARKYSAFNCEKGMPIHDLLNHAIRHVFCYLAGDRSEDHLGHAAWGLLMSCHSEELWPHLNAGTLRGPGCTPPVSEQAAPKDTPAPAHVEPGRIPDVEFVPVPVEANGAWVAPKTVLLGSGEVAIIAQDACRR